jgi:hypothetical protein
MGAIWEFAVTLVRTVFGVNIATTEEVPVVGKTGAKPTGAKKERIPPEMRKQVWAKYFGSATSGKCYCCNDYLPSKGWHCSHVIAEDKGGVISLENLRPCCAGCNLSMGNCNLYAYAVKKNMGGLALINSETYFRRHPEQRNDKRTNNYGR